MAGEEGFLKINLGVGSGNLGVGSVVDRETVPLILEPPVLRPLRILAASK